MKVFSLAVACIVSAAPTRAQTGAKAQAAEADDGSPLERFVPVTDETLRHPDPADWLMYSRTYDAQREGRRAATWGLPGTYDPVRRLLLWGISNPMPITRAERHGGDAHAIPTFAPADLYSNSAVALRPDTGERVFWGDIARVQRAFDAETDEVLWESPAARRHRADQPHHPHGGIAGGTWP